MSSFFLTDNDLDKKEYSIIIEETMNAIVKSVSDDKAYRGLSPNDLSAEINKTDILPQNGIGFDKALQNIKEVILPNFLRTFSTDYMAHLHSPALIETIATELIIATFNQSMDSWDQSPVATEVEVSVVKKLCTLFGYKDSGKIKSDGCFTSGGSQSNLTGIFLARDWYCNKILKHDVKKHGLPESYRKFRMYVSEISHFSMEKSAHLLGLGYEAVVKVPVTIHQKMNTKILEQLIEDDLAKGLMPFCVVATIGTTDYGSIDSLEEIKSICLKHGMYLHSDAAYGSGLIMSGKYKNRIENIALSDSITVDFHKMFLLPISCSAILVKDSSLFDPLEYHADYLNREEDEEDGYTNLVGKSLQTTRRFDALKVWTAFQVRGEDGFSSIIDTCVENASYLFEKLSANPNFETTTKPEISSVVFRVLPKVTDKQIDEIEYNQLADTVNKNTRRALLHQKGIVIGQTVFDEKVFLKFTLLNPRITHQKLDELIEVIFNLSLSVEK